MAHTRAKQMDSIVTTKCIIEHNLNKTSLQEGCESKDGKETVFDTRHFILTTNKE